MQNRNIEIKTGWGGVRSHKIFEEIISLENLFLAWNEFRKGKRNKIDVQEFEYNLENNIFTLQEELRNKTYRHSNYTSFYIKDPKLRHINKAFVRDRVLHQAVFRILYPIFDKSFIFDSYSCRNKKGTHKAVNRLDKFSRKISRNNTKTCFALKCDVKKYFDSISHDILIDLIEKKVKDENAVWLIEEIIKSYSASKDKSIPLGNITSQLFANIYLNEFDQFIKHKLKVKCYIRYCDDFVILSNSKEYLRDLIFIVDNFLKSNLKLLLHPDKIEILRYHKGIDFLGYLVFPHYRILRVKTKRRIIKSIEEKETELKTSKITKDYFNQIVQSYLGVLKHCNSYKIKKDIFNKFLI